MALYEWKHKGHGLYFLGPILPDWTGRGKPHSPYPPQFPQLEKDNETYLYYKGMTGFAAVFINIHKALGDPCIKSAAWVLTVKLAILPSAHVKNFSSNSLQTGGCLASPGIRRVYKSTKWLQVNRMLFRGGWTKAARCRLRPALSAPLRGAEFCQTPCRARHRPAGPFLLPFSTALPSRPGSHQYPLCNWNLLHVKCWLGCIAGVTQITLQCVVGSFHQANLSYKSRFYSLIAYPGLPSPHWPDRSPMREAAQVITDL